MYYILMAQPKKPPISIRLPDPLLAEVDEWAKARGLKRHAAILALIDFGLATPAKADPVKAKPPIKPKPGAARKLSLSLPSGAKLKDPSA